MDIKSHIKDKIEEYKTSYLEQLSAANANHGAMQAMEQLLADIVRDETQAEEEPAEEGK